MNKIRVIDLLNKIANGEEVPNKIKYRNDIYILTDNYCYYCDETNLILSDRLFAEQSRLNDEVEIIEEKKIPEKLTVQDLLDLDTGSLLKRIVDNQNEIIDYLKSKGE